MEFGIETRDVGDQTIVAVTGELDVYTAPDFEACLEELVKAGKTKLVIDLTGVSFLDSTGLGVMVKALKWVREAGGRLRVVADEDRIARVFRITGLDDVLALSPALDQALGT
ncbi:MAG: STAS domain-containing protein [Candidatus Nanopelagicales bacterium]|nr:STAS domain-containing protein [Candidatus Nanopelagicales bacterium]